MAFKRSGVRASLSPPEKSYGHAKAWPLLLLRCKQTKNIGSIPLISTKALINSIFLFDFE